MIEQRKNPRRVAPYSLAAPASRHRHQREFTLYLSTRWDMTLERAAFRAGAAPALKQMLDARGVAFGYSDVRSDLSVEELNTPRGVETVLVRETAGRLLLLLLRLHCCTQSVIRGLLVSTVAVSWKATRCQARGWTGSITSIVLSRRTGKRWCSPFRNRCIFRCCEGCQ